MKSVLVLDKNMFEMQNKDLENEREIKKRTKKATR